MNVLTSDVTLEHIDDWFKLGKSSVKIPTVSKSKTGGRALDRRTGKPIEDPVEPYVPPHRRYYSEDVRTNYAKAYCEEEDKQLISQFQSPTRSEVSRVEQLDQLELDSDTTGAVCYPDDLIDPKALNVYNNYSFAYDYDTQLPIEEHREQIITTIESNQVTVIQGPTGSGKTTQVPQYILDFYAEKKQYCNIIVTQPRRIAAVSIARRVCQERRWPLGSVCGYQVGMDKMASSDSRLLYVTTGVLLQKLINAKSIKDITHVVLDEVHERDQDTDFSILVVRKLLRTNSRHVKVVLMSATLDSDLFAKYFAVSVREVLDPAPVITVCGHTFNVSEYYVEDLKILGVVPPMQEDMPMISPEAQSLAIRLIMEFDSLEAKEQGLGPSGFVRVRGTVLIFLPGLGEINSLFENLQNVQVTCRLMLIPVHSTITIDEQNTVFSAAPAGFRKVILSTNIAESSITVPDIKYVIDFCLTKNLMCDTYTNYTSLQVQWASKANCIQRKGRAGRVSNGRVYRMITRQFWREFIPDYGIPEMQRCPLDLLVLRTKLLDIGEPKAVLALALSPPNLDNIERTILVLKEIGALSMPKDDNHKRFDGDLTFLGRVIASMPVDIRIGKLLVLGHVFGFLEECLILAAALSLKSIFSKPFKAQLEAYKRKFAWADGSYSDCIAIINAYKVWESNESRGYFKRKGQNEYEWGRANFIQIKRIREMAALAKELEQRLIQFNIHKSKRHVSNTTVLEDPQQRLLLKLVLCGAFYPNYFVRERVDEQEALKTLSGKDPFNTVMMRGLPANQGSLYKQQMEDMFKVCGNVMAIHFEETRAFVEFMKHRRDSSSLMMESTGKVNPAVYLAIKLRLMRISLELQLYSKDEAHNMMSHLRQVMDKEAEMKNKLRTNRITVLKNDVPQVAGIDSRVKLPGPLTTTILICVTEVVECGHFWAQYAYEENMRQLYHVQRLLNEQRDTLKPLLVSSVKSGMYCAAPYEDQTREYYRARVEAVYPDSVEVFFVDYGNVEKVQKEELLQMQEELHKIPFQAFECYLCAVKPSTMRCSDGRWSEEATDKFKNMVSEKKLYAQVFSILGDVLRVDVTQQLPNGQQVNINQKLIKMGYADSTEESYLSKKNNEERNLAAMSATTIQDEDIEKLPKDWIQLKLDPKFMDKAKKIGGRTKLYGPSNPYEMTFTGMTNTGRVRGARFDPDSVNCVAIDNSPEDTSSRMVVAAFVTLNPSGMTMIARDTTIMPHIPGLPAIVSMLFTPKAEIRVDPEKRYYTGVICGLGNGKEAGGAIFPDHDIEIEFDTTIDIEDIYKINGVRLATNILVGSQNTVSSWDPDAVIKLQRRAREKLLELVQRKRKRQVPCTSNCSYEWNQINPEDILQPEIADDCPMLLNLHSGVALIDGDEDDAGFVVSGSGERSRDYLKKHLQRLWEISKMSSYQNRIVCEVCNKNFQTPQLLQVHLETQTHQTRESLVLAL